MAADTPPARWKRIKDLFAAALAEAPDARAAFLETASGDDPTLAVEVLALLRAHDEPGAVDRLAGDVATLAASLRPVARDGQEIGHYRIETRVAGGGMGEVYRAHDRELDRRVALKFLAPHLGDDPVAAERFEREARAIAALDHPNICAIHEIGTTANGARYLVMPYYEGITVQRDLLAGPMPATRAVAILIDVLRGLGTAHARGIVHRDIKPSNVLVTGDGVVKLLDFGVAKLEDAARGVTGGGPVGTAAYMSPEQAVGGVVDARSDLWSAGAMFYEMLTGERPYTDGHVAARSGEQALPAPSLPPALAESVPPSLREVTAKALQHDPAARYQTAAEFEEALHGIIWDDAFAVAQRAARRTRTIVAAMLIVVALLAGGTWYLSARGDGAAALVRDEQRLSIAVLPIVDRSVTGDQQYYADGLTEELIATLSRVDGLRVASSTSSFAHRASTADLRTIGRQLGVSHVVEGNLQRSGDQLRIRASLVRVSDGFRVWSQLFERPVGEAFVVQQDIAQAVARGLQLRLVIGDTEADAGRPDAAAYELYLKGRYAWGTRSEAGLRSARRFFELAVARDSTYAPAWVGVADANAVLGFYDYLPPREAFPAAEAAAERAIALDPALAAPHATLGYVALYYHWDLAAGEAAFKRALELDDSYATGHQWYANLLVAAGRFDEAVREMQRAQQEDPLSLIAKAAEGWVHHFAGEDAVAMERLRAVLAVNPDYATALTWAGDVLAGMDSLSQAIAMHRRLVATSDSSGLAMASLARTLALAGEHDEARLLLARLDEREAAGLYVPSYDIAKVHVALRRHDLAFAWLRKAREQRSHSMMFLRVDPAFRGIRGDPAFLSLLVRVEPT